MKTLSWLVLLVSASGFTETLTFDSAAIGRTPAGWAAAVPQPGTASSWRVLKDPTAPTQPYVLAHVPAAQPGATFPIVVLERSNCRDGEISVKFKAAGGKREQDAGLVWRYRDPKNYYVVRADAHENNVAMFKVVNGKAVPLAPRGRPAAAFAVHHNVNADTWGILKVVFKGPVLSVYYDHRRILQVEDHSYTGPGKVGLWTREDSLAFFDNFQIVRKQ
jgi:hypothetical protein